MAEIPETLAALIDDTWPEGVIEEFNTADSDFYVQNIQGTLEEDLTKIRGASLAWQTGAEESDGQEPIEQEFLSYHLFFLSPDGDEFHFQAETEAENPEDGQWADGMVPGEGLMGCTAALSLVAPVAAVDFSEYTWYEDGGVAAPDIIQRIISDENGEPITPEDHYRSTLSPEAFQKMEVLRGRIIAVLQRQGIDILDESVLELPAPDLRATTDVFLENPDLVSVREAFFFRGA